MIYTIMTSGYIYKLILHFIGVTMFLVKEHIRLLFWGPAWRLGLVVASTTAF